MTVREINLKTGEETQRNYTEQELANIEAAKLSDFNQWLDDMNRSDREMSRVREDIIDIKLHIGMDVPDSELKKRDKKKALRAKKPKK